MTKGEEFISKLGMYLGRREAMHSFSMMDECDRIEEMVAGYKISKAELADLIDEIYKKGKE